MTENLKAKPRNRKRQPTVAKMEEWLRNEIYAARLWFAEAECQRNAELMRVATLKAKTLEDCLAQLLGFDDARRSQLREKAKAEAKS